MFIDFLKKSCILNTSTILTEEIVGTITELRQFEVGKFVWHRRNIYPPQPRRLGLITGIMAVPQDNSGDVVDMLSLDLVHHRETVHVPISECTRALPNDICREIQGLDVHFKDARSREAFGRCTVAKVESLPGQDLLVFLSTRFGELGRPVSIRSLLFLPKM